MTNYHLTVISGKVVELARHYGVTECECAPFARKELLKLNSEVRPSLTAVLMSAKRELWGLK